MGVEERELGDWDPGPLALSARNFCLAGCSAGPLAQGRAHRASQWGSQRRYSAPSIQGRTTATQHLLGNSTVLSRTSRASGPACTSTCTDTHTREGGTQSWRLCGLRNIVLRMATGECCGRHSLHRGNKLWGWTGQKPEPVGSERDRQELKRGDGGTERRWDP